MTIIKTFTGGADSYVANGNVPTALRSCARRAR
jgi:hypothetical protein